MWGIEDDLVDLYQLNILLSIKDNAKILCRALKLEKSRLYQKYI